MHLRHACPLKSFSLAFIAAALLAAAGAPAGAEAAEDPSALSGGDENKPRKQNTPAGGGAQPGAFAGPSGKDPVMLRDITVTATRTEREVFDVPSSAAVVGKEQVEREPHSTIARQLQDIPGIQVSDGGIGGGAKRISIRGESPSRVLVLIDGMKISEQKSMDGSMIMIDPLNVERLEVIKGPASVLYGSEAIGGVVNIITKKGGTRPVQGTLAFTGNTSNKSVTPYASLYGSYNGFNYRVSGDYVDAGDKRGGSGRIPDTGYMEANLSAYLDYSWDKGKVGAGYDHYWSSNEIPGVTDTSTEFSVTRGTTTTRYTGQATTSIELDLPKWTRDRYYGFVELNKISENFRRVNLTGYYQNTVKDFLNNIHVVADGMRVPSPPASRWQMDMTTSPFTHNDQDSYGLNLQTDWSFGDHYVIAGVDYLYDNLDAYSKTATRGWGRPTPPGMTVPMNSDTYYSYEGHQSTLALFVQDEWTFLQDWTLTAGLRQTWVQSALDDTNDARLDETTSSDNHLVGSLGLVYSGLKDWRFRALYSQGYRYPLLNQLYIGTSHGSSGYAYPDPDLKPETSQNFEIGARYDANGFAADLALFYSMADDYITNRRIPGTSDSRFQNVDSADTYGAELTLSYTYEPWSLTPYVSGAYLHRTLDDDGGAIGKTSNTGDPRWTGRAGLRWERDINPRFNVHTDLYGRFAARAKEDLTDGATENYAGWGTANFAVGARFGEERNLFVDLNLNNLLDKRYTPASSSIEDPGFHAVVRVGVEF